MRKIGGQVFLEGGALYYHTPQWAMLDLSTVDAILISNPRNMLALPFITQYSAFQGKIYATDPVIQIGR